MLISRRSVLAAIPLVGCAGEADARANTFYVAPDGAGDGSSWEAAAALADIAELIALVEPGGQIFVAADRGEYAVAEPVELAHGGRAGHEVWIRGVDSRSGEPLAAVLRSNRGGAEEGSEGFRLLRGASHLKFSHFDFRDIGNGAFRVAGPLSNLTIEDCAFENIYRFLENTSNGEGHASIDTFALRRCRGLKVERGFLRIRYNSRTGLIENCAAQGLANEGGLIPAGCALDDRASGITYRRCVMEGFQQWRGGEYWNGDGFSDEPDNRNIRYEACEARGATDGGFDCKSRDVVLTDCIAEDNKRNFRIWSDHATLTNCISRNPNFRGRDDRENASPCHIWIGGEENIRIEIANLTVEDIDATPIIEFNHDVGRVQIRGVTINSPRVNWGNDEDRIRAGMLIGEPRVQENMANKQPEARNAKQ